MSLKIDEYLNSSGVVSELIKQQTVSETTKTTETAEEDRDSYISTIANSEEAIPCENYNDILQVIQKAKAEASQSQTSSEETEQSETVSAAGGAGGSGSGSGSEEETTTEIVVINGVTYLETTTVTDGVKSVKRTVISEQRNENNEAMVFKRAVEIRE